MRHWHFYVYMLLCRDGSIYVGHTDDLDHRLGQHQTGGYSSYTSNRRPVRLIWCELLPTRDEAFAAERQIKGWRRSKKLALARGELERLRQLAWVRSPERRAEERTNPPPLMARVPHHERLQPSNVP